jgi:hypothetical protein
VTIDRRYRQDNYKPGKTDPVAERKARFDQINQFIMAGGGWVTGIPGGPVVDFEVLEKSAIPLALTQHGYDVRPADPPEGQRLLAAPIVEKLTLTSSGAFEPLTDGSTKAVVEIRTHAGIVRVMRYSFTI